MTAPFKNMDSQADLAEILRNPAMLYELLSRDAMLATELRNLQQEVREALESLTSETQALQNPITQENAPAMKSSPMSFNELRAAAKRHETAIHAGSDMARNLSLGVLINATNLEWNPDDTTTYRAPEDSILLALLEADLSSY